MSSLKAQTFKGIGWTSLSNFLEKFSQFCITLFLARILTPDDFGIIGIILIFSGLANVFRDFGFTNALIQRKEIKNIHYQSIFWLNIIIGTSLTLIFV